MGKCLIAIIDMQIGFENDNTRGIDCNIIDFLREIKDVKNCIVVGTRYINNSETACYKFEGWKACMEGSFESEIMPSLLPYTEHVFDKNKYSCWNDEFKKFVKDNHVDKIYFVGVNTGCCVLHSAFDCYNDVFDCAVIKDLCGSTSGKREHEAALIVLESCITKGRVITSEQAIEEIISNPLYS